MGFHMKTTLEIDATVMRELKKKAAAEGTTMSALVESALRKALAPHGRPATLPPLPTFSSPALVDTADRDALQAVFDEEAGRVRR